MNILEFKKRKQNRMPLSLVTCYDHWSAKIIAESNVDAVLVGDSAAMVMHGYATTLPISVETMALHVSAVARGTSNKLVIADMPFLSFRKSLDASMQAVEALMKAGAQAIKLEGVAGNSDLVKHIVQSGVPVMGHIGLTPQSIHQLGGFHVQGREIDDRERLLESALALEEAGCFSVVLECVPADLAGQITSRLSISTIGIGAGPQTDGQILVLQDLLGMNKEFKPKFLRRYLDGHTVILKALNHYVSDVQNNEYPSTSESYE